MEQKTFLSVYFRKYIYCFSMIAGKYKILSSLNAEIFIWALALLYLAWFNPYQSSSFSFCVFHNLGIDFCPGCGLGRSISFIFKGDFARSFHTHPLGIIALCILLYRITYLAVFQKKIDRIINH